MISKKYVFTVPIIILTLFAFSAFAYAHGDEDPIEDAERHALEETVELDESVTYEELGIEEPTILPGNPLYIFKSLGREIQSFFTFNSVKKIELRLRFANEKLMEVRKLNEAKKDASTIRRGLENYEKEMDRIKKTADKIAKKVSAKDGEEDDQRLDSFLDKFVKQQALHHRILKKLEDQVPAEAFEKIKETREAHIERFGEIMIRLEKRENIQERLEKNLQGEKDDDDEFRDFKNIEILEDLEEKVPETSKEVIRKARENIQIKLEERLKKLPTRPSLEDARSCIELWDPVCGKDKKTYSNKCFAGLSNVEVESRGKCRE